MEEERYYQPENGTPAYRSKAEVQIARLLDRERIAFHYEHPLAVIDRKKLRIWYPDFSLSHYGMIIEYFGMNDDPGYRERSEHKVRVYRENGIDGLFLTEESFKGDWPGRLLGQIEGVLQDRLDRFYASAIRTVGTTGCPLNTPGPSGSRRDNVAGMARPNGDPNGMDARADELRTNRDR